MNMAMTWVLLSLWAHSEAASWGSSWGPSQRSRGAPPPTPPPPPPPPAPQLRPAWSPLDNQGLVEPESKPGSSQNSASDMLPLADDEPQAPRTMTQFDFACDSTHTEYHLAQSPYVVPQATTVSGCTLRASGAEVFVQIQKALYLINVTLKGKFVFRGDESLSTPCIISRSLRIQGDLDVENCPSRCLQEEGTLVQLKGTSKFMNCNTETGDGGGMHADAVELRRGATLVFNHCRAPGGSGGALYVRSKLHIKAGASCHAEQCLSRQTGGCISAGSVSSQGSLVCQQGESHTGGCLYAEGNVDSTGSLQFKRCWAEWGGAIRAAAVNVSGTAAIEASAGYYHGAVYLSDQYQSSSFAGPGVVFKNVGDAGAPSKQSMGPAAIVCKGTLFLKDMRFVEGVSHSGEIVAAHTARISSIRLIANGTRSPYHFDAKVELHVEDVDCKLAIFCTFKAPILTGLIKCDKGKGQPLANNMTGCDECPPNYYQTEDDFSGPCHLCGDSAEICRAGKMQLLPGNMQFSGDSQLAACPNPQACGGGELPRNDTRPMCQEGYAGLGCADCVEGHAASDGSVLVCVRCPESVGGVFFHLLLWLGRLIGLFALATKSVLESEGDAKASSVYLNQLLSFSTLSGTILAALLQTPIGQEMRSNAAGLLFSAAALITDLASGQGSGSESTGQSLQCTLSFFGMVPAMWKGHLAFVFVTTTLTCSLAAMKGRQAALVIGINCFFPEFLSHFGRQLVCYRLGRDKDLLCPHVPAFLGTFAGFCLVAGCAMAFTAAVFGTWWYLYRTTPSTRSKKHKASEHPEPLPAHVCFLTAPYRKQFAKWETERLVRKSVFTFAAAALPVCASPAMQLSILGLVALASLVLYAVLLPYTDPRWNMTEVAQLTTCVATIFPVMSLLVSDVHWGESKLVQLIVVTFTAILDAGICSCLFYLTVTNMLRERAKKTHNPSKTAVKPAEPLPEYPPGLQAHFPPGLQMPSSSQQAGRMQIVSPNHMPASHYPAGSRTTPAAPEPGTWQVMHPDLPPGILQGRPHGDLPQYPPGILPVMHPPPPDAVAIGRQASNAPPGPATPKNTAHPGAPAPAG